MVTKNKKLAPRPGRGLAFALKERDKAVSPAIKHEIEPPPAPPKRQVRIRKAKLPK